jgi:CRISPR-associated protein Cmr3
MKYWTFEPRDVALFRDARPFGVTNNRAYSLNVPRPATVAGFLRTHVGSDPQTGKFVYQDRLDELTERNVRGPVVFEIGADETVVDRYFPAPADAVFFRPDRSNNPPSSTEPEKHEFQRVRFQLTPRTLQKGELTKQVLEENEERSLELVDYRKPPKKRPGKQAGGPLLWSHERMEKWLNEPKAHEVIRDVRTHGVFEFPHETRTHVSIDRSTGTAKEGHLFSVDFVRYTDKVGPEGRRADSSLRRLGLLAGISGDEFGVLADDSVGTLGGERRVALARELPGNMPPLPSLHEVTNRRLRLILITPAIFEDGALPSADELGADNATLVAAAVGRAEPISGWDYAHQRPKPTTWLVPHGSVFWLEFETVDAAKSWHEEREGIATIGTQSTDGFGQVLIGDGGPHE